MPQHRSPLKLDSYHPHTTMDSQPLREPSAAFSDRPRIDELPQSSYIHRSFTAAQRPYARRLRHSTADPVATSDTAAEDESVWGSDTSDLVPNPSQLINRPAFAIISNVALKAEPAVCLLCGAHASKIYVMNNYVHAMWSTC